MSNLDIFDAKPPRRGSRRVRRRSSRRRAVVGILLALAVALAGVQLALPAIVDRLSGPADFPGPGTGSVQVEVVTGQTLAQIGNTLKGVGVVASVDGFTRAAAANPDSSGIQPGFYTLRTGMPSAAAVAALLDAANRVTKKVLIPEGKRTEWVLDALAKGTGIPRADFDAALKDPAGLGLPDYAKGNPEGFLFPATYEFPPNATAAGILTTMITKFRSVADEQDLSGRASALGLSPYQVLIIASLLEVEGHPRDFDKVARVVYNRLAAPMRLEFDSTVNYGLGKTDVIITQSDLDKDTPYNTYLHDGLPPTPIDNPGAAAIKAALEPAAGDWLYFITVDLGTQETEFTKSYSQFLTYKDQFLAYCAAHPGTC